MTFACAATIVAALLSACGTDIGSGDASSGFAGPVWTATEDVRIGSVDDPVYALTAIRGAAVGPDGSVFTLHRQDPFVRRWSAEGEHLADIGRQGEGPGEFESPRRMGFFGDSLWVWDGGLFRATWLDREGNLLGTASPEVDLGDASLDPNRQPARPLGPLRDGTWWGQPPAFSHLIAAGELTRAPFVRMDGEGEALDTAWIYPYPDNGVHSTFAIKRGTGGAYMSQPLGDAPLASVDAARMALTVVDRWAAPEGAADAEWTVRRLAVTPDTLWTRAVGYAPVAVAPSYADSLRDATIEISGQLGLGRSDFAKAVDEGLYLPAHYPPVESAVLGHDGTTWIAIHEFPDASEAPATTDTRLWYVFDEDGADLAQLRLPRDLRVLAADRSRVWGTLTDELDVPYLVGYGVGG